MLGLLFIYFIGKYFFQLAEKHNENKWLFAVLGVVVYYASGVIIGIILGVLGIFLDYEVAWDNGALMTVVTLVSGISSCWLFYYLLEKKWDNRKIIVVEDINDIGKDSDEI